MKVCILGSGSGGNAIALWEGTLGLLIDFGLSYKQAIERMAARGIDPMLFRWGLISHSHLDHHRSVRMWMRENGVIPYCSKETQAGIEFLKTNIMCRRLPFRKWTEVGPFQVLGLPTHHNATGAQAFVVKVAESQTEFKKLACFTETGKITEEMWKFGHDADVVVLEANHDRYACVTNTERPDYVNERTLATHLNNDQAAMAYQHLKARMVFLVHLSSDNNSPELVRDAIKKAAAQRQGKMETYISLQDRPTPVVEV
jgi:ribonuclease BN (tRNA processing enzyme)